MLISDRWCLCVDDVLTPAECRDLIRELDHANLEKVERGDMATYARNIKVDSALAAKIYARIQDLLPSVPRTMGCNEYMRFSKYEPGEEFKRHRDGINQDRNGFRAKYTVNIFLNEDFAGGETEFYDDSGRSQFLAVPATGRGMIFDNQILHSGNRVGNGYKYLIRTDVMVRDGI
jgi:predicted 2-oxoglutarate/Fe(II)-dependent dioxygenase YbiX